MVKDQILFSRGVYREQRSTKLQFPITAGLIVLKHLPPGRIALPSTWLIQQLRIGNLPLICVFRSEDIWKNVFRSPSSYFLLLFANAR